MGTAVGSVSGVTDLLKLLGEKPGVAMAKPEEGSWRGILQLMHAKKPSFPAYAQTAISLRWPSRKTGD